MSGRAAGRSIGHRKETPRYERHRRAAATGARRRPRAVVGRRRRDRRRSMSAEPSEAGPSSWCRPRSPFEAPAWPALGVGAGARGGGRRSRCRPQGPAPARGRKGTRPQLTDDGARLDAAILVLVARPVELQRAHVPRRTRHLAGAVADAADGEVPVAGLRQVATPRQENGRPARVEMDGELRGAVARRRTGMGGAADGPDRPAPDGQPSRDARIILGTADGQTVGREPVGREGGRVLTRHRRAHRRDAAATRPQIDGDTQPV